MFHIFKGLLDDIPWKITTLGSIFTLSTLKLNELIAVFAGLLTIAYTLLKIIELIIQWLPKKKNVDTKTDSCNQK